MSGLDGNAAAGILRDVFGFEVTAAVGQCEHCGRRAPVAEAASYVRGPGVVLRCRTCTSVLLVIAEVRGINCVSASGLRELEDPHD
jgi:Family of unknown function (DUF6510)